MASDQEKEAAAQLGAVMYAAHKINDHHQIEGGVSKDVNLFAMIDPKGGSYRYARPDTGEVLIVQPGDRMYSASMLLAEEWFDGKEWKKAGI